MRPLLLATLLLLSCATTPKNAIKLTVKFVDREDIPYADTFHVCVPEAPDKMRCVDLQAFMAAMKDVEKEVREKHRSDL